MHRFGVAHAGQSAFEVLRPVAENQVANRAQRLGELGGVCRAAVQGGIAIGVDTEVRHRGTTDTDLLHEAAELRQAVVVVQPDGATVAPAPRPHLVDVFLVNRCCSLTSFFGDRDDARRVNDAFHHADTRAVQTFVDQLRTELVAEPGFQQGDE